MWILNQNIKQTNTKTLQTRPQKAESLHSNVHQFNVVISPLSDVCIQKVLFAC